MTESVRWQRIIDLEAGVAMVVTDLHGDWELYQLYRDRFLELRTRGRANYFILTGDLIHSSGSPDQDGSLNIVLDVLRLRAELGEQIIYLLGNHELPHIYSITLQKGKHLYTSGFETVLGKYRHQVLSLFDQLPFYVRTRGGVVISHAGASTAFSEQRGAERLFNFSHKRVWRETIESLPAEIRPSLRAALSKTTKRTYDELVQDYFAVTGPGDPRYDHFLIGAVATSTHPDFQLLWDALFTRNELQYGEDAYTMLVASMLTALSNDYYPQRVLVAGHIDCRGGYKIVASRQLRLASGKHAISRDAALYLLFNTGEIINTTQELLPHLSSVFRKIR